MLKILQASFQQYKNKELPDAQARFWKSRRTRDQIANMDEAQAGIKTAGRNINNLRYADDTTLMAESEEELKGLLMKVKEGS